MTAPFGRSKRHLEIALPDGASYARRRLPRGAAGERPRAGRAGRTPLRSAPRCRRGAAVEPRRHGRLAADRSSGRRRRAAGPSRRAVGARHPSDVERLAANNVCPPHRAAPGGPGRGPGRYRGESLEKRISVLDLLETYPSCQLTFAEFLEMLPAMRVRQYSISSSPRRDASRCTLTVAVVDAPAWSGIGHFRGTCSSYLSQLQPGDKVAVAVRTPKHPFHPAGNNDTPIVMVCAGTGLAPFRGFIQDRAHPPGGGEPAGPALLFFGCDHPQVDFLYREELQRWQARVR